ncbi:MAG: SAM-dependent methyltransferase [Deltaproteobacteria bacterium]|nr:MAG: SAM-dependent methyltransferase [Deltaproteobacteria bacterium]
MLANRVRKTDRHLRKWARREDVTCYRVYDRDIPEIPLAVDRYGDRLYVAQYATPHKPHTEQPGWADAMVAAAAEALDVPPERVHVRVRRRRRDRDKLAATGRRFEVREGGLRFWVNLDDYLDTGLFLDHRITRARVRAEARGARVLNLFGYTGSFSVYAAAGGAASTWTVDASNTYLAWAADNFALNGLRDRRHRLDRADVLAWLDTPPVGRASFDLAVLDPPTFSHGKRFDRVLDTRRDHLWLIDKTLDLLAPGGVLYFSTNARKLALDPAALRDRADVQDITAATTPPDFRRRPHRCWRLVVRATRRDRA